MIYLGTGGEQDKRHRELLARADATAAVVVFARVGLQQLDQLWHSPRGKLRIGEQQVRAVGDQGDRREVLRRIVLCTVLARPSLAQFSALTPRPKPLDDVAGRYWLEKGQHYAAHRNIWKRLALLVEFFGKDKLISDIADDDVANCWRHCLPLP